MVQNEVIEAVNNNDHELLEALLIRGADVEACDRSEGLRALAVAARAGFTTTVQTLLDHGAKVYIPAEELEKSPAVVAAVANRLDVVRQLKRTALPNRIRWRALATSCLGGNLELVKEMISLPYDLNQESEGSGIDLLAAAADGTHIDIVSYLIQSGAKVRKLNHRYTSSLHLAAAKGHLEVVHLLLEADADLTAKNGGGLTPLSVACYNGQAHVARALAQVMDRRGLNIRADNSFTALHYALGLCPDLELVRALLEKGADPDLATESGLTPLRIAIGRGLLSIAKLLIEYDVDVNAPDQDGSTAISIALGMNNIELLQDLIASGAVLPESGQNAIVATAESNMSQPTTEATPNLTGTGPSDTTPVHVDGSHTNDDDKNPVEKSLSHTLSAVSIKDNNNTPSTSSSEIPVAIRSLAQQFREKAQCIRLNTDLLDRDKSKPTPPQYSDSDVFRDFVAAYVSQTMIERFKECNNSEKRDELLVTAMHLFEILQDDDSLALGLLTSFSAMSSRRFFESEENFPNPSKCIDLLEIFRLRIVTQMEVLDKPELLRLLDDVEDQIARMHTIIFNQDGNDHRSLQTAIKYRRNVANRQLQEPSERLQSLWKLNELLMKDFAKDNSSVALMNEAIEALRMYICLSRNENKEDSYIQGLNNLAHDLKERYAAFGRIGDIEEALSLVAKAHLLAEKSTMPSIKACYYEICTNYGNILDSMYETTGQEENLFKSVKFALKALSAKVMTGDERIQRLCNIAYRCKSVHERTQIIQFLNSGLKLSKAAFAIRGCLEASYFQALNTFCGLLHDYFHRQSPSKTDTNQLVVLSKLAILYAKEPVVLAKGYHNISTNLAFRYQRFHEMEDLHSAISYSLRSLRSCSWKDANRALYLSGLGNRLELLYEATADSSTIESAISIHEVAVNISPNDVKAAYNLATATLRRSQKSELPENEQMTASKFEAVLAMPLAPATERIKAGGAALLYALINPDKMHGYLLVKDIQQMLPNMIGSLDSNEDLQHVLAQLHEFPERIVCACLQASKPPWEAMLRAEAMRGIAMKIMLAKRLPAQTNRKALIESDNQTRYPGPQDVEIMEEAQKALAGTQNAIVDLSLTRRNSYAVIMTANGVSSLKLSHLHYQSVELAMKGLTGDNRVAAPRNGTKLERNARLRNILSWLWADLVQPVLKYLDLLRNSETKTEMPQIWWLASGSHGSLPFHAAGDARTGSFQNTMDHVISSYIPSVKGLNHAYEIQRSLESCQKPEGLLVTMPRTDGLPDIDPKVEIEAFASLPGNKRILEYPSAHEVLIALRSCHMCHLSCHGIMDATDPFNARLILGSATEQDPLSVKQVLQENLKQKRFLYLAACSTAQNSAKRLGHEVIHLATAFQLAGFPSVAGSLWEVEGLASGLVSAIFYRKIGETWNGGVDGNLAQALHSSIYEYRKRNEENVLSWAPFVFYGV
ncbi:Ankyrin-2 [Xylographa bjoerkii]|nr:Ankyrin-2 [Xylographa bjoerkii]